MSPKAKKIIGWILAGIVGFMAIGSAFGKFTATADSEMGVAFTAMGFFDMRFVIGTIELVCAVLFLIPRTSTIGVLLSAGYWGGAMATDITHGQFPGPVLVILLIFGLATIFRNPELFARLLGKPTGA